MPKSRHPFRPTPGALRLWVAAWMLSCTALAFAQVPRPAAVKPDAGKPGSAAEPAADDEGLYVIVEATQRPMDGVLVLPTACGPYKAWCNEVQSVLHNDMRLSGVVRALELKKGTVGAIKRYNLPAFEVNLAAARKANVVYAVASWARKARGQKGQVELHVGVINVRTGKRLALGRRAMQRGPAKSIRRLAHRAANAIFGAMTGVEGSFDDQLFYSSPGPGCHRCIWMADADGYNARIIVGSKGIHMLPRPTLDLGVNFVSFAPDLPSLFRLDGPSTQRAWAASPNGTTPVILGAKQPKTRRKKRRKKRRRGLKRRRAKKGKRAAKVTGKMPGAPAKPWATGANLQFRTAAMNRYGQVVATINDGDQADLWLLGANGKPIRNLTNHESDDLDPSWSPDGTRLAFVSNRTGRPQIYTMNADGSNVQRMTFAGPYNTGPDWGADNKIVYSGLRGSAVDILTVDMAKQMQRLTPGRGKRSLEPSWASCGRRVVYVSNEDGRGARLWIASHDGAARQALALPPGRYYTPVWRKKPGVLPTPFRP
ncbi:MAG: PD40 domain-containing protein [Myxococcales bacterium]|nr:PD40 domain-containing protein [Myxococcales bacterium]